MITEITLNFNCGLKLISETENQYPTIIGNFIYEEDSYKDGVNQLKKIYKKVNRKNIRFVSENAILQVYEINLANIIIFCVKCKQIKYLEFCILINHNIPKQIREDIKKLVYDFNVLLNHILIQYVI